MAMESYGLYIHIPFCRQKCYYCDFPSVALAGGREKLIEPYVTALCRDIANWQQRLLAEGHGAPATIYIGGGTPTVLSDELLERLLSALYLFNANKKNDDREFSVEVNPGTVTEEKLRLLKKYGVNRLSIGVQSFDDECLKRIGRIHSAAEAYKAVEMAQNVGFDNISIDLIYGLPGQSFDDLRRNVSKAVSLQVQHISIYGLQVEDGTVFGKMQEQGRLQLPTDEETEKMYDYLTSELPRQGFLRYEISNFAKSGCESRHNLSYWQDIPYIGLGAGAHSYWQGQRYFTPIDIQFYIAAMKEDEPHIWQMEERLTEKEHMEEFCFLGLRTTAGISRQRFIDIFGKDLDSMYGNVLLEQANKGLLQVDEQGARLTKLGMKYGNQVFQEFLL